MFREAGFFAQICKRRLQPANHVPVLQPQRIFRKQVFNLRREFGRTPAQFDQPMQQ